MKRIIAALLIVIVLFTAGGFFYVKSITALEQKIQTLEEQLKQGQSVQVQLIQEQIAQRTLLQEQQTTEERLIQETENLFDISTADPERCNPTSNIVYGTASQLNGFILLDISDLGAGEYSFEWDYANSDYATDTNGPCLVGLDKNNKRVTVVSGTTNASSKYIGFKNYSSFIHKSFTVKFSSKAQKIAFGVKGTPDDHTIFLFKNIKIKRLPSGTLRKYADYFPNTTSVDYVARAELENAGFLHDGMIFRMDTVPDPIPVDENHLGYNEFIDQTWNTLLPDDYHEGDPYNAETTKIRNVKVERVSKWNSTKYGKINTDVYPLYRYIFTPQNGYEKTVLLTAGCHGNEAEGYWGLYRLIRMIYFEGYKYPTLRNLRNIRFIIIPSWNPWSMQHYRRYNAFSALGEYKGRVLQAWRWLYDEDHSITIGSTEYSIKRVGEANIIWETLQEYQDALSLWLDFHTDPYSGRSTKEIKIDDPREYEEPYGCYGFATVGSKEYYRLADVIDDFHNILRDEYHFETKQYLRSVSPAQYYTGWQATLGFPCAVLEVSTFMDGFPYKSGSGEMMKLAQEFYGNCLAELLR